MKYFFPLFAVIFCVSCRSRQENNMPRKEVEQSGLILTAKLIRTFYGSDEKPVKYIRLLDTLRDKYFEVDLTLKNNTDTAISFWMMSCSWKSDLMFSNESFYVSYIGCDKNFPQKQTLNPNDSLVMIPVLARNLPSDSLINDSLWASRKKQKTSICFMLRDSINIKTYNRNTTCYEDMIWSNELALEAEE